MKRTEIHIERLVLDGLDFTAPEVGALRAALETELAGAFGGDGAGNPTAGTPRSAALLPGSPGALGREAALAIHRSIRR